MRESDYVATGFDFHRRGRREEEQLETLRRLEARTEMGAVLAARDGVALVSGLDEDAQEYGTVMLESGAAEYGALPSNVEV